MATRKKTIRHADIVREVLADRGGNNSKKKSPPSFVKLDGLSQSAKDRLMNNRTVKPPKNINLVEGDPLESMESERKSRQLKEFPNEYILSAKIKEVNGMDYSNHSIEQYYRNCNSGSISPEHSEEDSTNSSTTTNESMQSVSQEVEEEEEACGSNISISSTNVDTENGSPDDPSDPNDQDDNNSDYNLIRNSRYSKNAAIIGLIKNKIISLNDLELNDESAKSLDDLADLNNSLNDIERVEIIEEDNEKIDKGDNYCGKKFDNIPEYPHLVPHPEDSDFYAHPLVAHGKLEDCDIDFRLPRVGVKATTTSRQYFIREGLNDDQFTFQKTTIAREAPKPKFNINNLPKIKSPARSLRNDNKNDNSYDSLINDENDGFKLNRNEFPTLQR